MAEQIDGLVEQLGPNSKGTATIEVYPLLELARQRDYASIGRRPLGLDSEDGKRKALAEVHEVIVDFRKSDWLAYKSGCSEAFVQAIESPDSSRNLLNFEWDILIEFGCVLAAQGILGRGGDLEKYLRVRRVGYMMPLSNNMEKEVVFTLWGGFLSRLKDAGLISADQVVSDYLNELQTFYWEAARTEKGFDVVFVDETHLFNAQERLIFHHLLVEGDSAPLVVMALDPKQSPRELFTAIADERDIKNTSIYERARLPKSEKIDLVEIYRYTPQIERLVKTVLNEAPGLDFGEDWDVPAATSTLPDGPIPLYKIVANKTEIFAYSIRAGKRLRSEARSRGGQVAILCMDQDRFCQYKPAVEGQFSRDVFVISSRDDTARLRFMARRIVFSTPEYVAGLQFDTVILVDVNRDLVTEGNFSGHQQRRFLSELYLGMSRAEHQLYILAARDGDGLSPYLSRAEREGLLLKDG